MKDAQTIQSIKTFSLHSFKALRDTRAANKNKQKNTKLEKFAREEENSAYRGVEDTRGFLLSSTAFLS